MSPTSIRRWHLYCSVLAAPSVVFFALTGAVQLYGLHEARGSFQPIPLVEKLGTLHKNQVFALGRRHGPPPSAPQGAGGGDEPGKQAAAGGEAGAQGPSQGRKEEGREPSASVAVLKAFFLVVSVLLTISSLLGVWMALTQTRKKVAVVWLLVVGTALPVVLSIPW